MEDLLSFNLVDYLTSERKIDYGKIRTLVIIPFINKVNKDEDKSVIRDGLEYSEYVEKRADELIDLLKQKIKDAENTKQVAEHIKQLNVKLQYH